MAIVSYTTNAGLSLGVRCGFTIDIALFATPVLVLVGTLNQPDISIGSEGTECVAVALAALLFALILQPCLLELLRWTALHWALQRCANCVTNHVKTVKVEAAGDIAMALQNRKPRRRATPIWLVLLIDA